MSLPATENTSENYNYFIRHIVTPETKAFIAGAIYEKNDIVIIGNYVGICEAAVAVEAEGSADIHDGAVLYTSARLGLSQNTFATEEAEVWYGITDRLLYDTYAAGRVGIGHITRGGTKDAAGGIEFRKRRYWVAEPVVPTPET